MRVLVIDNYDSFVYNLVQYLAQLGAECVVRRNDELGPGDVDAADGVLVSPGPGTPERAGASMDVIRACARSGRPVLGVCLGHQAIGQAFGGRIVRAQKAMHGKLSPVTHDGRGVFSGLPSELTVTRYHSLAIERASVPDELDVTATAADGEIMGVRHQSMPVEGVQFHPEALFTEHGKRMLANFLEDAR